MRSDEEIKNEASGIYYTFNKVENLANKIDDSKTTSPAKTSEYSRKADEKPNSQTEMYDSNQEGFMTQSVYLDNKDLMSGDESRLSIDFGGMQRNQNDFNRPHMDSRAEYDSSMYSRKQDTFYNPNMSTLKFMNEIDLRCDDHLSKFNDDVRADRFCSECKTLCCDACVIEYHHMHISSAKMRIEEYFKKQKGELEELRSKLNTSIKYKSSLAEVATIVEENERSITSQLLKRRSILENIRLRIDNLITDESALFGKLKESVQHFYKDECYKRIEKPLKETENLLIRLQSFLRDWESFSRSDKAKAMKNDQVRRFNQEASELNETVKTTVDSFKLKSTQMEKNVAEILKAFSYTEKLNDIDRTVTEIEEIVKRNNEKISKLNYEDLIVDNVVPVIENLVLEKNNKSEEFTLISEIKTEQIQNHQPQMYTNINPSNQFANPGMTVNNQQVNYPVVESYVNQIDNKNIQPTKQITYDYLIAAKQKTDEIVVYNPSFGAICIKLNKSHFQDPTKYFTSFPDNCRYVNLGFSVLVTGGYVNKQMSNHCHLIVVIKKERPLAGEGLFDISVIPYENMLQARERHNIISLPDRNMVLVCSGFFNQGTEVTDLNTGTWKQLSKMNEVRGNATIAYVNKRYVYVFGGFQINDKQQGLYLDSAEVLDVNNIHEGWRLIPGVSPNLRMSAMGVINVSENTLLLCGGFDGGQYKKDIYKVDLHDSFITKVEKVNLIMPGNYIFLHNNFIKIGGMSFNFDLTMNVVGFNPNDWSFNLNYKL